MKKVHVAIAILDVSVIFSKILLFIFPHYFSNYAEGVAVRTAPVIINITTLHYFIIISVALSQICFIRISVIFFMIILFIYLFIFSFSHIVLICLLPLHRFEIWIVCLMKNQVTKV